MNIIGKDGIRGYFLKLFWIKLSIIIFIVFILPLLDIVYFFHILGSDKGGLLFHSDEYSGFEKLVLLINFLIFGFFALILLSLFGKDENKPGIEIKNKKDTYRDVLLFLEIIRKLFIAVYNIIFSFSFYCYHCKTAIKVHYHTKVNCNDCSDYGKLSSKLLRCRCQSILRYIECPNCGEELDLIKKQYNHKELKLSKYE